MWITAIFLSLSHCSVNNCLAFVGMILSVVFILVMLKKIMKIHVFCVHILTPTFCKEQHEWILVSGITLVPPSVGLFFVKECYWTFSLSWWQPERSPAPIQHGEFSHHSLHTCSQLNGLKDNHRDRTAIQKAMLCPHCYRVEARNPSPSVALGMFCFHFRVWLGGCGIWDLDISRIGLLKSVWKIQGLNYKWIFKKVAKEEEFGDWFRSFL